MRKIVLAGIAVMGGFIMSDAQCKTVTTISENFDAWKEINKCWTAQQGKAMLYASDRRVVFYSMTSPREKMTLITPKIKAGKYSLTLDASDNGGETAIEIVSISNVNDAKSFIPVAQAAKIEGGRKAYDITLKKDSNIGIKVMLNGIHQAVYIDNFSLKPKK